MKQLRYIWSLVKFAFKFNPLLYLSIAISLVSVAVELLAMSSLLPLFNLVSGNISRNSGIVSRVLELLGCKITARAFFAAFIGLFAIRIITQLLGQSLSLFLGRRVMAQLGSQAFEQIMCNIPVPEIDKKSIGYFTTLAGDETFRASTLVISLTQFVATASLGVFYYLAILDYSTLMGGLVLAFLLFTLVALFGVFRQTHRLGARQIHESRRISSVFLDSVNNLKSVRTLSAERYVTDSYKSLIYGYSRTLFLIDDMSIMARLVPVFILLTCVGGWLLASSTAIEQFGIAFIVTMTAYLMRFFPVAGQGLNLLLKVVSDAKVGRDVTKIIGLSRKVDVAALPTNWNIRRMELRDVSFYYEDKEKLVLKNVNIVFEKNRSYAVCGRSGVGKSTLVDLLLKFYSPSSGVILVNETDMNDIAPHDIRKQTILVCQDAAIFDDTVLNNICLGIEAEFSAVQAACKAGCIHDTIESMPSGYSTRLQYQGNNLSGGQRQRIAIARALLRNPNILILDESTSALDKATQEQVIDNILKEYADRVVIFITHDPSIMQKVDEVIDLASAGVVPELREI
jgi:ABC-type bacteriocin/lantibiotic exporter with double-glycine peptidase domain